jgi:hypothetical protein
MDVIVKEKHVDPKINYLTLVAQPNLWAYFALSCLNF